jgi:hypothetical protein
MVAAQQDSIARKTAASRRRMNKFSELSRRLSGIATQLIDLTGSGLHVQDSIILPGLLDGCVDDPGMRGTDCIRTTSS